MKEKIRKKKDHKDKKRTDSRIKKYCIFVDTENVGYRMQERKTKKTDVYYYQTDQKKCGNLPEWMSSDTMHIVNLFNSMQHAKNELDFIILTDLVLKIVSDSEKKRRKTQYAVLSKDKGFDLPLTRIRKAFPDLNLCRMECSLADFDRHIEHQREALRTHPWLFEEHPEYLDEIVRQNGYSAFCSILNRKQKSLFREYPFESEKSYWIEYDFYQKKYNVYQDGTFKAYYSSHEDAVKKIESLRQTELSEESRGSSFASSAQFSLPKISKSRKGNSVRKKSNKKLLEKLNQMMKENEPLSPQPQRESCIEENTPEALSSCYDRTRRPSGSEDRWQQDPREMFGEDLPLEVPIPREGLIF